MGGDSLILLYSCKQKKTQTNAQDFYEFLNTIITRKASCMETKKYSRRLNVDFKEYINILTLYFNRGINGNTLLNEKIKKRELELENPDKENSEVIVLRKETDSELMKYRHWLKCTEEYIDNSDEIVLKIIKEVYVFRHANIQAMALEYYISERNAYRLVNLWFEGYRDYLWQRALAKK